MVTRRNDKRIGRSASIGSQQLESRPRSPKKVQSEPWRSLDLSVQSVDISLVRTADSTLRICLHAQVPRTPCTAVITSQNPASRWHSRFYSLYSHYLPLLRTKASLIRTYQFGMRQGSNNTLDYSLREGFNVFRVQRIRKCSHSAEYMASSQGKSRSIRIILVHFGHPYSAISRQN